MSGHGCMQTLFFQLCLKLPGAKRRRSVDERCTKIQKYIKQTTKQREHFSRLYDNIIHDNNAFPSPPLPPPLPRQRNVRILFHLHVAACWSTHATALVILSGTLLMHGTLNERRKTTTTRKNSLRS